MDVAREHISFRLTAALYDRIEALRVSMSNRAGVEVDRAKVLRMVVERGLAIVESELAVGRSDA